MKFWFVAAAVALATASAGPAQAPAARVEPGDLIRTMRIEPGRWLTLGTIVEAELTRPPGLPPLSAESMASVAAMRGVSREARNCVVPNLLADGSLVFPGGTIGRGCTYPEIHAGGGRIRLHAICSGAPGAFRGEVRLVGDYTARSMTARMTIDAWTPANGGYTLRTVLTMRSSHEVGACSPPPNG